jgi:hypothetical protein
VPAALQLVDFLFCCYGCSDQIVTMGAYFFNPSYRIHFFAKTGSKKKDDLLHVTTTIDVDGDLNALRSAKIEAPLESRDNFSTTIHDVSSTNEESKAG